MSKHSKQFKLSVIKDYLVGVGGYGVVAQRHGIDASSVRRWLAASRFWNLVRTKMLKRLEAEK